ncbi:aminotransferase class V-fold PLP-dependent enzyme [Pararhodobacter zhoushanensis]|uniref:Aminotransferase class V-fold PLP-dependent enzyme n=1 Tax=Pararhodobacter zhoushanensis TaxID=2479545 RepID=A0ABT3H372_9RHOB|nr:aminotransferase class V-fold PLP-dependent enzyme [Pararhodobacter zhoushanensis]MCW1934251.1 aminotransferase class V-fold PLP-dependent enzyme [Pararhodobacter zhoushanensis]
MFNDSTIAALRRDFPYLAQCTYLDSGATGLAAPGTGAAAAHFYDAMQSRGFDGRPDWMAMRTRVEGELAALLGVAPDWLDFGSSSTDVLNRAMQAVPVSPGDKIVLAADEFPSVLAVAQGLETRGAVLDLIDIPDESDRTARLIAALPGARYVAVSHVHWETGTRVDLAALSTACRTAGAVLVVDGVHAVGAVPVDAALADLYVTSFFKWTMAGFGLGLSVTSPLLRAQMTPQQRGYANPAPSKLLQPSHVNYPGLAALEAALKYLAELGWEAIFERVALLQCRLADQLRAAGFDVVTPRDAAAGLVSVTVPDPERWAADLAKRGVKLSARGAVLRIAPHIYNTQADLDACCAAMIAIAGHQP